MNVQDAEVVVPESLLNRHAMASPVPTLDLLALQLLTQPVLALQLSIQSVLQLQIQALVELLPLVVILLLLTKFERLKYSKFIIFLTSSLKLSFSISSAIVSSFCSPIDSSLGSSLGIPSSPRSQLVKRFHRSSSSSRSF